MSTASLSSSIPCPSRTSTAGRPGSPTGSSASISWPPCSSSPARISAWPNCRASSSTACRSISPARSSPVRHGSAPRIATHIHAHAWSQKHYAKKQVQVKKRPISRAAYLGLIDSLESLVRKTEFRLAKTEWGAYYEETNYSDSAFALKKTLIEGFLDEVKPRSVWDLGANTGVFSRLASGRGIPTVAFDIDFVAVELDYRDMRAKKEAHLLPLVLDLTNPSPALGWAHEERASLVSRGPADTVLALALIHHLAISNNLPFDKIAAFFASVCRSLIIEFVPKSDSQVQKLLATREDIFPDYSPAGFEAAFKARFRIRKTEKIAGSDRLLYLMEIPDAPAR